ncbi:MAG: hypothetical protein GX447_02055 [Elusimicrobia bacterium]|nr:hypothetical protein [Elusimicrobiota bacterium]
MPEFHLFNIEETAAETDEKLRANFIKKTEKIFPRFLFCLSPGDKAVFTKKISPSFYDYAARVLGISTDEKPLIFISKKSRPYYLCDSLICDEKAFLKTKKAAKEGFSLSVFIETPKTARVAKEAGFKKISGGKGLHFSREALLANDKSYFKKLCSKNGVPYIKGYTVSSMAAAERAIKTFPSYKKIFLKKTLYGGGMGNMFGRPLELIDRLENFYNKGTLIIEPFLEPSQIIGTLCEISREKSVYIGCDRQKSKNGKWSGFDYEISANRDEKFLKEKSVLLSEKLRKLGFRGIANFDWLKEKKTGKIYALEANLRNNGFYFLFSFAKRYFKEKTNISYREGLKTGSSGFKSFSAALEKKLKKWGFGLIKKPGEKDGFLIVCFSHGEASLACFSASKKKFKKMKSFLEENFK